MDSVSFGLHRLSRWTADANVGRWIRADALAVPQARTTRVVCVHNVKRRALLQMNVSHGRDHALRPPSPVPPPIIPHSVSATLELVERGTTAAPASSVATGIGWRAPPDFAALAAV